MSLHYINDMKKYNTLVSVCICTYNQDAYLERAIRSVADQRMMPLEIIVSDDCSTDSTPDILERLSDEIQCLKVVRQHENVGIARNVDSCLRLAVGEYVVRLDSDDFLNANYIEKLVEAMSRYPRAGYAHSAVREVDEHGELLKERKLFRETAYQTDVAALRAAVKGYRVAANILMFRRNALEKVGYLTGRPNFGEDYHLTAAISAAGYGNIYVAQTLAFYRVWTDPGKLRSRRKQTEIEGLTMVFEEVIEPAYQTRSWASGKLSKKRTALACHHADCLSWDFFNVDEKRSLMTALYRLSPATRVKVFSWLYLEGYGGILTQYYRLKADLKSIAKSFIT